MYKITKYSEETVNVLESKPCTLCAYEHMNSCVCVYQFEHSFDYFFVDFKMYNAYKMKDGGGEGQGGDIGCRARG